MEYREFKKLYEPDLKIKECSSFINYAKKMKIDFNVYLEKYKTNLQRDLCWNLEQKQELINSILIGRHIPHLSIINTYDDVWLIIDGKQRLNAIFSFIDNTFKINIQNIEYYFRDLPEDFQSRIMKYQFRYYLVDEVDKISDDEKVKWFRYLNFGGTPQDKEHLKKFML